MSMWWGPVLLVNVTLDLLIRKLWHLPVFQHVQVHLSSNSVLREGWAERASSGNGTKHVHFGTVTFHQDQSVRILGSPYPGIVPVDLSVKKRSRWRSG